MQSIRIVDMPPCKMATSGPGFFGMEKFDQFVQWFSAFPRTMWPRDFLCGNEQGMIWLYMVDEHTPVPAEFEVMDFPGGMYTVATDIDMGTDMEQMNAAVDAFLRDHGFERDDSRMLMGNIITSPVVKQVLGYDQMDYYTPIKPKA